MKINNKILIAIVASALVFVSCEDKDVDSGAFGPDINDVKVEATGGNVKTNLRAYSDWIASTDDPWILITPANGTKSTQCNVRVDSTVKNVSRTGKVTFTSIQGDVETLLVEQDGFPYKITVDEDQQEITIPDWATKENAVFYIDVTSNTPFKVDNGGKDWINVRESSIPDKDVFRSKRPRTSRVYFEWLGNTEPEEQNATISFLPTEIGVDLDHSDVISVTQEPAPKIVPGREGDSTVLVILSRVMDFEQGYPTHLPMEDWKKYGVTLNKEGRVSKLALHSFLSEELFPYHIEYLTELEELEAWGVYGKYGVKPHLNANVAKLTKLKVLKAEAMFLESVDEAIGEMDQLEHLSLAYNSLQELPEFLDPANGKLPNLKHLELNTNRKRSGLYDMQNTSYDDIGLKGDFPAYLLAREDLETLTLGVNYYEGEIPDMSDYPVWTEADGLEADHPAIVTATPKVLPNCTKFSINLNKFSGELPNWILNHPNLCKWNPEIFIFNQEGLDSNGQYAKFSNIPFKLYCENDVE